MTDGWSALALLTVGFAVGYIACGYFAGAAIDAQRRRITALRSTLVRVAGATQEMWTAAACTDALNADNERARRG